jgi:peptide/nickel transport system permease protein
MSASATPSVSQLRSPERPVSWSAVIRSARNNKLLVVSGAVIAIYILLAIIGPYITPQDPFQSNPGENYASPSWEHWFGTDKEGRDVFSRMLYGARYTMIGAFAVMGIAAVGGFIYGLVTAYVGGWFDRASMRLFDLILSFPPLIIAIILVATFGPGLAPVVIGVGIGYLPAIARIIRSEALIQRSQQYVAAGVGLGYSTLRIVFRQIMPNCTSQIIVQLSMNLPYAIIDIAGLSFLGFGVQPPTPDWGSMLAEGQSVLVFAPWLVVFPSAAITILVLSWNVFGARLRRALDPKRY